MSSSIRSLGKETIIYGLGDALYKAVAFILLPVYLRYLSPADFGVIEALMVTRGLAVTIVAMGLPNAIFRFYYRAKNEKERKKLTSTIFFISIISQISIPLLMFSHNRLFADLILNNPEYGFYVAVISLNVFLVSFRGIPLSLLRAERKPIAYSAVNFAVSAITMGMNIYFVVFMQKGITGVIYGNICGGLAGLAILAPYMVSRVSFSFDFSKIREIMTYSLPLALAALPLTVILMADRYFIIRLASPSELGIYALAYKLANILKVFIIMPFVLAWGPFVFSNEGKDNAPEIYSRATSFFATIMLSMVVIISVLRFEIIGLLAKDSAYYPAADTLPVLCYAFLAFGLASVINGVGIRISGKTYFTTLIMIFGMILNLGANYIFIKLFSYNGAALALLLTFTAILILSYRISTRIYSIKYQTYQIIKLIVLSLITVILSSLHFSENYLSDLLYHLFLIGIFLYYIYFLKPIIKGSVSIKNILIKQQDKTNA